MSKKKKGKGRLEFPDLVQRYKSQDFQGAYTHFKKAFIKPHEQDDARRLRVELTQRFAADLFEKHQFSQALAKVEELKPEDFPKKGEALLAANHALAGLCRLYLGEWENAAKDLETASAGDVADHLDFYYLLALTYGGKFTPPSGSDGEQAHAAKWEKLPASRQLYLRFAASLVARNWTEANRLLAAMEPLSDLHGGNLRALRTALASVLAATGTAANLDPALVKPLYKVFARLALTETETGYLEKRPVVGDFIRAQQQAARQRELSDLLATLCEQGRPLTEAQVEFCLARLPAELHPYVVYNQAATLFRENQEENGDAVNHLADKYPHLFFQIPEGIFLYLRMVSFDAEGRRAGAFFTNLEQSLRRFGESLTNARLNEIGWLCFDAFIASDLATKTNFERKRLVQLSAKFPQIIGFKLWMILESAMSHKNPPWQDALLDVFALPNVQDFGDRIVREVDILLEEFYPHLGIFQSMLPPELQGKFLEEVGKNYVQTFEFLQKQLLSAAGAQGISPRSKFVLDVLKTLHRHQAKLATEEEYPLPPHMFEELLSAYRERLAFFGENTPDSPYFHDYQSLEALPDLGKMGTLLNSPLPPDKLRSELAPHARRSGGLPLADVLVKQIEKTHFNLGMTSQTALALSLLAEENPETAVGYFSDEFVKLAGRFQCHCHEPFFVALLDLLTKKYNAPPHQLLTYRLALAGKDFLTASDEASFYNTAAAVLDTIRRLVEKDKSFHPDISFVTALLSFIGAIARKKNLKSLGNQHKYLTAFFKNN